MKQYDITKEKELLDKLNILAIRRSMRPCMKENREMWLLLEELHLMTGKEDYKL